MSVGPLPCLRRSLFIAESVLDAESSEHTTEPELATDMDHGNSANMLNLTSLIHLRTSDSIKGVLNIIIMKKNFRLYDFFLYIV